MGRPVRMLVLCLAVLAAAANPAWAVDRYVDDNGTGAAPCTSSANPCPMVATGIAAAGVGDTIRVGGGDYNEALTLGAGKSLVKANFNPALTAGTGVIDGGAGAAITVNTAAGTIEGFTLRSTSYGAVLNAAAMLRQNTFDSATGSGVNIEAAAGAAVVDGNTFNDPNASGGQTAIITGSTGSRITDNGITGFSTAVSAGGSTEILRNTISGIHGGAGGVGIEVGGTATISDNVLNPPSTGTETGIRISGLSGTGTLRRNRVLRFGIGLRAEVSNSVSMNGDVIINGATRGIDMYDGGMINRGDVSGVNVTVAGFPTQVYTDGANLTLDDSIIGNVPSGDAILKVNGGSCSLSEVRGPAFVGIATDCRNFFSNEDPGFVNLAADNAHLQAGSAMIDRVMTGNPEVDLDGDARPTRGADPDNTCTALGDIGADEYAPPVAFCSAPQTTITAGPSGETTDRTPTFQFASSKSPSTYECSVDEAAFATCTTPLTTATLGLGRHTFAVRATEKHGFVDATPATRSFSVEATDSGGSGGGGGGGGPRSGSAFGSRTLVTLGLAARRIPARGPLRVRVTNRNGFRVTGRLSGRTTRRIEVSRKRRVKLRTRSFTVGARARRTVRLRLPGSLRRVLRRTGRLSLRLTAKVKDPAGRTRTVRKTVRPRARQR